MASSTVEDYVKAIYLLQQDAPTGDATVARLAATLGITKGSVTAMVRKLREADLVDAERYGGIRLTPRGRTLALDMIRRHRLIEVFLVDVLGFDWSEVHEEAERLEHAMSATLLDRLDAYLGHPSIDPHGDPIPDADGRIEPLGGVPLAQLGRGDRAVVLRVTDQDPAFLAFAAEHGLRPGARISVRQLAPQAGSIRVKAQRSPEVTLALDVAEKVVVSRAEDRP